MLGITFADYIDGASSRKFKPGLENTESLELIETSQQYRDISPPSLWKRAGLKTIFFIIFAVILTRITTLQIIKGKYYQGLSDDNRIIDRPLSAPRGVIVDKNNIVLVRNTPFFKIKESNKLHNYAEFARIESTFSADKKEKATVESIREYQFNKSIAHVLGYISPISEEELKKSKKITSENKARYGSDDYIGRTGIEEEYETFLKGSDGGEFVEINSNGEVQKVLGIQAAVPGKTIQTTIDIMLQQFAYEQIERVVKETGAPSGVVIVQNPNNGEILTLASFPSYDDNIFTHPERALEVSNALSDKSLPLLNRAISGTFPPGSTYKIITALAGLNSKAINLDSQFEDTGNISISGITFNNWYFTQYGKTEGNVDLRMALARSNDTFFYKLSLAMGPEKLIQESHRFKLGEVSGIDIPGEVKGLIPTPEWKKKVKNEIWFPGNTVNMSIGQGDVLVTPLQVSSFTSAIANNGTVFQPSLVSNILDADNKVICRKITEKNNWSGESCEDLNVNLSPPAKLDIESKNIVTVQQGLRMVNQKGGTAYTFFDYPIETAGKTGTAESHEDQKPHAWYTGYAPYKNPEITVTVLVERGGEGSSVAAPLAKEVMDFYFKTKKK
ncbi:MAG: penicillin-binding protein 2 [bacterium]|nr:penicillin-binding protein 2 [bacterium]